LYLYDFKYDDQSLSDFGFIVCEIGADSKTIRGAEISFTLVPVQYGRRRIKTGSKYESTLSTSFKICKNPELFSESEMTITTDEFRALERWLNRREFLWFKSYDFCDPQIKKAWFHASFTLSKYEVGGEAYAIELNMQTDAPFGYGDEINETYSFAAGSLTQVITDQNDEIGVFYPDLTIVCGSNGELSLTNETTGREFKIEHCTKDEVITQHGDVMLLTSSNERHDIANDFNYEWMALENTFDERENVITASLPCDVTVRYRPIWKDTI